MRTFLLLMVSALAAFGQADGDGTSNTFVGALPTLGNRAVTVFLTVSYPDSAAPEDYIDVNTFRSDTTAALAGVANQAGPLEAFAAAVAKALYEKYPQLSSIGVQISFSSSTVNQQTVSTLKTRVAKAQTNSNPEAHRTLPLTPFGALGANAKALK